MKIKNFKAVGSFFKLGDGQDAHSYSNRVHKETANNIEVFRPENLKELYTIIETAKSKGQKIRAVGQGYSYSNVSIPNSPPNTSTKDPIRSICIKTGLFEGEDLTWDKGTVRQDYLQKNHLVSVCAGTSIQDLNTLLNQKGLAMPNLGGTNIQSVAGVLATSTHGSGIKFGPLADFVRSLVIVCGNGEILRLEPTNGITDKNSIEPFLDLENGSRIKIQLKQDDGLFYAAVVSLGSLGVIYSVVLEVIDAYKLCEERIIRDWEEVKRSILNFDVNDYNNPLQSYRHLEVLVNPYPTKKSHTCLLTLRYKTDDIPRGYVNHRNRYPEAMLSWKIGPKLTYLLFHWFKCLVPFLLNSSLKSLQETNKKDNGYVDWSYKVLNADLKQFELQGIGIELRVPLSKAANTVDKLMAYADELYKDGEIVTVPWSLRFVKASKAHLSMMNDINDEVSMMLEIDQISSSETYDKDKVILEKLQSKAIEYGARIHWGLSFKDIFRDNTYVNSAYPTTIQQWRNARNVLDPQRYFENQFSFETDL